MPTSLSENRVGIFGGTFDPPHQGHIDLALEAMLRLDLRQLFIVPAAANPLKDRPDVSASHHRVAMCRLAFAHVDGAVVSEIEARREPPSYMIDTVREMREVFQSASLHLIVGRDCLASLGKWREVERLAQLCRIEVFEREGYGARGTLPLAELQALPEGVQKSVRYHESHVRPMSSTQARECVMQGDDCRDVPIPVMKYIREHGLYRAAVVE